MNFTDISASTGSNETMKIAAGKAPKFKAGKALKDAINE
jgi:nucleoid DNA-binding protein